MKPTRQAIRLWAAAVLLTLVAWVAPQGAQAADGEFDTPSQAFTWYSKGQGCIHMKILALEQNANRTLDYSTFYVKDSKDNRTDIFYFHESDSYSKDKNYVAVKMRNLLNDESKIYLTNDNDIKPLYYVGYAEQTRDVTRNSKSENCYAEFDWYFPVRFAGQKLTLCVEGQILNRDKSTRSDYKKEVGIIDFDEIMFDAYDVMPGSEEADLGLLLIPVASDRVMNWVEAKYKDAGGNWKTLPRQQLEKNAYSAFVRLPAYEPHPELTITANVVSATIDINELPDKQWPSEVTGNITKTVSEPGMIHGPILLTAEEKDGGKVQLQWQVASPKTADVLDGDLFDVQRSLTGRADDYESLGQLTYDMDSLSYTYIDSTLVGSLTASQIDKHLGIPLVRYRVIRSSTQTIWGTNNNPAQAYAQPQFTTLSLLQPKDAQALWTDTLERKIQVTWDYEASTARACYVWDERAEMRVEALLYNREGKRLDSIARVLTTAEIKAKKIEMALTRSCVKYDLFVVVDGKKSPIGRGESELFVTIRSDEDLFDFARSVDAGETQLNAIMLANLNVSGLSYTIGNNGSRPYQGNFNGNGYKLNYSINQTYADLAPFRFLADGAVIANLTVEGNVTAGGWCASGMVSHVYGGTVCLENFRVGTTVKQSAVFNDCHFGGVVAIVENGATLFASNGVFYGHYEGRGTGWNGFAGERRGKGLTVLSQCYFNATTYEYISKTGATTFLNYDTDSNLPLNVVQECYYKTAFGQPQGAQADDVPENWKWQGNKPALRTIEFSKPLADCRCQVGTPDDQFYYQNSGTVVEGSLETTTLQSSVLLQWKKTDGAVDYFEVSRRNLTTGEAWKTIATQIIDLQYEDKTVSPVFDYEYRVSSNNDCEGRQTTYTSAVAGHCVKTGKVEGYVRFADGTGIPGVRVTASQHGSKADPKKGGSCETDESGFYSIEGLDYWGHQQGEYQLTLAGVSADVLAEECKGGITVTFDHESNYYQNRTFSVVKGVRFSGLVMYNGTSIPVHGARFLVDGREVRSGSNAVETDFEGKFSFRMLAGKHNIQCTMDGHQFWQQGYYKNTKEKQNFEVDVANVYFYDDTRVKLIGRVAGGHQQGNLPLGNSLSTNNLGDNLKMVLALEGDNASWLVFDNVNRAIVEHDTTYIHAKHGNKDKNVYKTRVHTTRHRMEVWPDSLTGEYEVLLPPVKWKIQQITAEGYATLFQEGKTSDVIDLADSLTLHTDVVEGAWKTHGNEDVSQVSVSYNAQYSRIYRSPVLLERKQVGYDKFDYFGDRIYTAASLVGDKVKVPLVYQVPKPEYLKDKKAWKGSDSLEVKYTFGHPVFNTDRGYPLQLSAVERYYYNNNTKSDTVDVVRLDGGLVTIRNGLISGTHRDTLSLDSVGEGYYVLRAAQRPYLMTGSGALCTVTFSMERDGMTYEGEPLKAYTLSQYAISGAKDYMSVEAPVLVDVLRDPPGGGSSAKLSKGSTLKLAYQMDMSWKAGLTIGISTGASLKSYAGLGSIGAHMGFFNSGASKLNTSVDIMFSGSGQRAFSYTMTTNEDISTDAGSTMVGADADVYMGFVNNIYLRPTIALRAIPDSTFRHKSGELLSGRMVEIACGYGEKNDTFHLVRDEIIGMGQKVTSNFVHSQQYITKQLIPTLAEESMSKLYVGTRSEAQTLANSTGKRVYLSLREKDDPNFGVLNTDSVTHEYIYNSTLSEYKGSQKLNYLIVVPNGDGDESKKDEIHDYALLIQSWCALIQQNEQQKLEASDLVNHFDVDGGATITYSEDFASDYTNSNTYVNPLSSFLNNYFEWDDVNATHDQDRAKQIASGAAGIIGPIAAKLLAPLLKMKPTVTGKKNSDKGTINDEPLTVMEFAFGGHSVYFDFTPVVAFSVTPKQTLDNKYSRKETFTIKMDKKSHLAIDVYRVKTIDTAEDPTVTAQRKNDRDVFTETNFLRNVDYVKYFTNQGVAKYDKGEFVYPKSFVYRTRGGATVRPWENERKTQFYHEGTLLDERTKKIENPIIKMDRQSISGVPMDEPARFRLYMTNDSEQPEAIGGALQFFTLYLDDASNPKGARLTIDGMPLSRSGITVIAVPGKVTEKTLEVWAGEDYDYENLKIGLISQGDVQCVQEVAFSVHFLRTAGNVEIAMPGDKWIMNTDAPFDKKHGWYIPVIISGFNKNQKNFDHIEFQYKESTRGDDYWTNLCAFYADSTLYKAATGTHEMIPENGNIVTKFYGDGTVMEKAYDLRARLYCRSGNSFITSDSKVLSGIKDTRRPQLFGTPEPKDGIIGAGDNIVFNFSEAIEHNYLQQATNFEVVGETNETALCEEPSLLFSGNGYAETDARRNFSNKNITIDLMVRPNETDSDMPIFSHGTDGHRLQLWITSKWLLRAVIDSVTFESHTAIDKGKLQHVALILDNEHRQALLYNDSIIGTMNNVAYNGYGTLIFGATNEVDANRRKHYSGRMLEARLWNRTMTSSLLDTYGKRLLTGYEMGLAAYYPMNEGESNYATDMAQGANAELKGVTWELPRGMSLQLDYNEQKPVKGIQLNGELMARSDEQDYTLMLWFKTTDRGKGALISNGSGRRTDDNARNRFYIGFEGGQLKYRTNGHEILLGKDWADDKWHHFALTVDRSHQVANIYLDRTLRSSFSTDTLGGMAAKDFYLGNMVWHDEGASVQTLHSQNALSGHIDDICLFSQALPPSLLKRYSTKSPNGKEKGLLVYLPFSRQERMKDNNLEMMPYALSQKVHLNMEGMPTQQHDTLFVDSLQYVIDHIDKTNGAPVQASQELRNLNFSFVGRDNQLLVNIDELNARTNKRNIYVTVTDIPDLNGNYMASPATVEFFVDRNPLRWERKSWHEDIYSFRSEYDHEFNVRINNNSGASHTYQVQNLPRWLTVDKQTDIIGPKGEHTLNFQVSKDLNVGTYDEIIYLTDEDGLAEPLAISIRKEGEAPGWEVWEDMKHLSMNVVGLVKIGDAIVTDNNDFVAAFDEQGRCMGKAYVNYNPNTAQSMLFITVFDSTSVERSIYFKLWHHLTGQVMMLQTDSVVKFKPGRVVGSVDSPVMMTGGSLYYQQLSVSPGWNWISFNVDNSEFQNSINMLNKYDWENGDIVTDDTEDFTLVYNKELGSWLSNKGNSRQRIPVTPERSYRIFVHYYNNVEIPGYPLKDEGQRTISVKNGWNNIGYTPMVNLPISTALADYTGIASNRDVVKSREKFAVFTETSKGNGYWSGSLEYMKPGEGYMLYRNNGEPASFRYPFYEPGSSFFEGTVQRTPAYTSYAHNMSVVASVKGVDLQPGDRLVALCNGERRGEAVAIDSLFFLSIAGEKKAPLAFAIEREGEIIASTAETMVYENNVLSGSPTEPTAISFVRHDAKGHDWYSVEGYKLGGKPQRKGIYIYNGKKQVVK